MNRNNDDPLLDEPDTLADFDDNGDFAEFDQKKSNTSFGSLVKNNPLIKIGMVVAALIIIVGSVMLFSGDNKTEQTDSLVSQGSDLKETPGSAEVSPEMKQALEEDNQARIEQAIQTGDSVLPTPIEPPKERLPVPENSAEDDPLLRWRQMQEERAQAEQQTLEVAQQQGEPAAPAGPDPALSALTAAMSAQMSQVLADKPGESIKYMQVTDLGALLSAMRQEQDITMGNNPRSEGNYVVGAETGANGQLIDPATGQPIAPPKVMIRAGTIEYGQMVLEANSDIPGPVVALLASGKFSGARLMGSFQKAEDDYLIITCNTLVDKRGVSIPIEAYAMDPNTTLTGMATDVDQRYWKRIILPAAADFIEGLGEAVAESGSTTVTVNGETVTETTEDIDTKQELYKGVERAAERVSDILDDQGNKTQVLIRVAAGTPLGILFTTSVTDQDRLAGQYNPQMSGGFQGGMQGNNISAQQQLLQSLTAGGGANSNSTNPQDTEALLKSLRDLQGQ